MKIYHVDIGNSFVFINTRVGWKLLLIQGNDDYPYKAQVKETNNEHNLVC